MSDPAKAAGIEEIFRDHPLQREESVAKLESSERHSASVLDRHDSHFLLIPDDEVQPWITRFNDRLKDSILATTSPETPPPDETVHEVFEQAVRPLLSEMAESIFTRDRLLQLVAKLKQYRNDRFAAGDHSTVQLIMGAIRYLEREDSPGENSFILALCLRSIRAATEADTVRSLQPWNQSGS